MQQSFIEAQFPVARISAEAYKERSAGAGQTLTRLGKWWGRKPLILVRACILGLLLPATSDTRKDREIFLKILGIDDEGAWRRCKPGIQRKLGRKEFDMLPYAERISHCKRAEDYDGPSPEDWRAINEHLGTSSSSLTGLVGELGYRLFDRKPHIGDCFSGGGSIPFEAARMGCHGYGSDLSPIATLLSWAAINLYGGNKEIQRNIAKQQNLVFALAREQVEEWKIEKNEADELADVFLYCNEVRPPGCDYWIPLAPNWDVTTKERLSIRWELQGDQFQPIISDLSSGKTSAEQSFSKGTVERGRVRDPLDSSRSWSIESLRGPEMLRRWTRDDIIPRIGDVFRERLYCIRWIDRKGQRRYAVPTLQDLEREARVNELLSSRIHSWQARGILPSMSISEGYNTEQPIRERGWTHWHQLFHPRQLLLHGLVSELFEQTADGSKECSVAAMLALCRLANWNSKLCIWNKTLAKTEQTFANQALNTLFNYGVRGLRAVEELRLEDLKSFSLQGEVDSLDARDIKQDMDIWITDPPYADAINYHELGDFFLSWISSSLSDTFPSWIPDSRSELAVRGGGVDFKRSMVEIYSNLALHTSEGGSQVVMFTHQDSGVWADLGMILWASGLKVTSAWTISTEKSAGLKQGNYIQGTVCLVLRKRSEDEPGYLFDVYPLVEDEVRDQLAAMQSLDEHGEPNFNDADYQLAAYAAALKVLTQYSTLDGKSVADEVFAVRAKNQKSDFEEVIERAITIACDALIPKGLNDSWRDLSLIERYYLRALDIESRGERRKGMYEELARGFGVSEIKPLLKSDTANGTRVHTPSGFGTSLLAPIEGAVESAAALPRRGRASASGPHPFAASPLRHLLFAICETAAADNDPNQGRQYLRDTFGQTYWGRRESMVRLLDWLAALGNSEDTADWAKDSEAARILAGRLRNDDA